MEKTAAELFRMPPARLADWLEDQGPDLWWTVDGDDYLLGTITLPTTAHLLAARFREVKKTLIVLDPLNRWSGPIEPENFDLNLIADSDNATQERVLCMRWDDERYPAEWLLCEDKFTPKMIKELDDPEDSEGADADADGQAV